MVQWIDGLPVRLKEPFDLAFLRRYGTVFKVFDGQDSGNLCFGVRDGDKRYFVKFAGAPTAAYTGAVESAIGCLKAAVPVYRDLAHPALIHLVQAEEIGGGFVLVFDWVDAVCAHRMYPANHAKFKTIPQQDRLQIFDDILDFHVLVAAKGYVAVDFYDGSIMWDFAHKKTVLCDIDFYQEAPYANPIGRMWGSTRFMSPEEFQLGAAIDEVTNVYAMGAAAFVLFADHNRTPEACLWTWACMMWRKKR